MGPRGRPVCAQALAMACLATLPAVAVARERAIHSPVRADAWWAGLEPAATSARAANAQALIPQAAQAVGLTLEQFLNVTHQIGDDATAEFLVEATQ